MPQSLSLVIVHLIFSTKDRRPLLTPELHDSVHAYLASTARKIGCECFRVGGTEDHVHLAVRLSRTVAIAELVEKLKSGSSKWLKSQGDDLTGFAWQRGYGCFSVSPKEVDALIEYIEKQKEHHKKRSFQEEFRGFLKKYGVEFDEQYVWD